MHSNTYNIEQMKKRNPDILKQFGERVRELRKAQGLSQEEFAEKADLHYTYIGGVERGERNLSLKSIELIASALKIEIRELFMPHLPEKAGVESNKIISDINHLLTSKNIGILRLIKQLIKDIDTWAKETKAR